MNIQFKKGVLDLLVLAVLEKKDMYGYDLSEVLSQSIQISAGTVYPILRKLKDEGLVSTYLSEESAGPARKYYKLTNLGFKKFAESKKEWLEFIKLTIDVLEGEPNE